jgi:hypothetical protein
MLLFGISLARAVYRGSLRTLHGLENALELAVGPVKIAGPSMNSALYRPQCNPDSV